MNTHRRPRAPIGIAGAAAFVIVGTALFVPFSPASADASDDQVTWSVRPSDGSVPDGRAWVEQTLAANDSRTDYLSVENLGTVPARFSLTAADGYFTAAGRFDMLPRTEPSRAAGMWISIEPTVTVAPGETVTVPFTTHVPENTQPGDYAAGIAASVLSEAVSADGTAVSFDTRMGFRVMTRVAGELNPAASVSTIDSDYTTAWNPLRGGAAAISVVLANDGNTRLRIGGEVTVGGEPVPLVAPDGPPLELLPGDHRTVRVRTDDTLPLGLVPVEVRAQATPVAVDGGEGDPIAVRATATMTAVPVSQLLLLASVLLLVAAIVLGRTRARRRLAKLVADAHEHGRLSATNTAPTDEI